MGSVDTGSGGDGQSRASTGTAPSLQPREGPQEPLWSLRSVAEPTAPALQAPCLLPSLLALCPGSWEIPVEQVVFARLWGQPEKFEYSALPSLSCSRKCHAVLRALPQADLNFKVLCLDNSSQLNFGVLKALTPSGLTSEQVNQINSLVLLMWDSGL